MFVMQDRLVRPVLSALVALMWDPPTAPVMLELVISVALWVPRNGHVVNVLLAHLRGTIV